MSLVRRRARGRIFPTAAILIGAILAAAGVSAAEIVPHKAYYALHLKDTASGSTLSDVKGAMYIDWIDSCEGWSSSQRLELRFYDSAKPTIDIDSRFASWESRDGLSYRFEVENLRNGAPDKDLAGKATLQAMGQSGEAKFTGKHAFTMPLPAGTIFPARHMMELIDHAAAGDKIVARTVFDGTSDEGPFDVNAVIGPVKPAKDDEKILPKSVDKPYRPMRLAFFNRNKNEMAPFYEMSADLMDNGIARSFVLDYGDSVIAADLERIEILAKPKC